MSRVYILGAGCSCSSQGKSGYPLAKEFAAALNSYTTQIAGDAKRARIRNAVEETASLLLFCQSGAVYASTPDQLVTHILNGIFDSYLAKKNGNSSIRLKHEMVRKVKIATSACFLTQEAAVRQQQLEKYTGFIRSKILNETGVSIPCSLRLQQSSARVLSFNYDQLFELAFFAGFSDSSISQFHPYSEKVLNSGVTTYGEITDIKKDKFCFLKLHGSAGMLCVEDDFGQSISEIRNVTNWQDSEISDELYFGNHQQQRFSRSPFIVYPYEKDFILSRQQNALPFRDYIHKVWSHVTYIFEEAKEVWIVGYSFDPTDCNHLIERLQKTKNCNRIVIQNLPTECDRIEALLKTERRIQIPIEKYPVPF